MTDGQPDGFDADVAELQAQIERLQVLARQRGLDVRAELHTLENKLARASTMLQNANDELRTHVGKARGAVARGRSGPLPAEPAGDAFGAAAG